MSVAVSEVRHRLAGAAIALLLAGTAACSRERVVQGECLTYNGADVCTWGRMAGSRVVAFGATVPFKSVENAPAEMAMGWPPKADAILSLPPAVQAATGFDNLSIFWEPHGHPPGPYLTPHFDFHFNMISKADIAKIDCADSTKPAAMPASYELPDVAIPQLGTLIGICVPGMGMHALPTAELHSTSLFRQTLVVGYYHQKPIFLEPMIARASLLEKRTFGLDLPAVAGVQGPAAFVARWDSTAEEYQFTFRTAGS